MAFQKRCTGHIARKVFVSCHLIPPYYAAFWGSAGLMWQLPHSPAIARAHQPCLFCSATVFSSVTSLAYSITAHRQHTCSLRSVLRPWFIGELHGRTWEQLEKIWGSGKKSVGDFQVKSHITITCYPQGECQFYTFILCCMYYCIYLYKHTIYIYLHIYNILHI